MKWIIFDLAGVIVHMYFGGRKEVEVDGKVIDSEKLHGLYDGKTYVDFMKGDATEDEVIDSFLERRSGKEDHAGDSYVHRWRP